MPAFAEAFRAIRDPRAEAVLRRLHQEADRQNLSLISRFLPQLPRLLSRRALPWTQIEPKLSHLYLAIDPANGALCYLLARALRARHIVEFGTSFGVSTIYLALAARDNGGRVIGTELVPEKAARARANLAAAGLGDFAEIREGDALNTLRALKQPVEFLLNDGFPRFTLPVLKLLAPQMRSGAIALCGNAAVFPADHADYLEWVRNPDNGFRSMHLPMKFAGELSVRN